MSSTVFDDASPLGDYIEKASSEKKASASAASGRYTSKGVRVNDQRAGQQQQRQQATLKPLNALYFDSSCNGKVGCLQLAGKPGLAKLKKVKCIVSVTLNQVIVQMVAKFESKKSFQAGATVRMPLVDNATVTQCSVKGQKGELYNMAVIANEDVDDIGGKKAEKSASPGALPNHPSLFQMPVAKLKAREVKVSITYVAPAGFLRGMNYFILPLDIPSEMRTDSFKKSVGVTVNIGYAASAGQAIPWGSGSHVFENASIKPLGKSLSDRNARQQNVFDFHDTMDFFEDMYVVPQTDFGDAKAGAAMQQMTLHLKDGDFEDISVSWAGVTEKSRPVVLYKEESGFNDVANTEGSYVVYYPPVATSKVPGRRLFFLLDRSGSMAGAPFQQLVDAVELALKSVRPADRFSICFFDHRQTWYGGKPSVFVSGAPEEVEMAIKWVREMRVEGATDILAPLSSSVRTAGDELSDDDDRVPIVFLFTDGAVANERDICTFVRANDNARCFTFGIGPYCNRSFLHELATSGRGAFDVALDPRQTKERVARLLYKAEAALVWDLDVAIDGVKSVTMYPKNVPNVYATAGMLVAGTFTGTFPDTVKVSGTCLSENAELFGMDEGSRSNTTRISLAIDTYEVANTPLDVLAAKLRVDSLVAEAWFENSQEARAEAIDAAVEMNVVTPLTSAIAYEMDETAARDDFLASRKEYEFREERRNEKEQGSEKKAPPKDVEKRINARRGVNKDGAPPPKGSKSLARKALIAGSVVGGVLLLDAAFSSGFGDVGATLGNSVVGEAFGGLVDGVGSLCGGIGDGVADCCGAVFSICGGGCGDCVGGCVNDVFGVCDGLFSLVGGCCGSICGSLPCGDVDCGFLSDCIGGICGGLGGVCGSCGDGLGDCVGSLGDCAGSLGGCLGSVFGALGSLDCGECGDCLSGLLGGLLSALK